MGTCDLLQYMLSPTLPSQLAFRRFFFFCCRCCGDPFTPVEWKGHNLEISTHGDNRVDDYNNFGSDGAPPNLFTSCNIGTYCSISYHRPHLRNSLSDASTSFGFTTSEMSKPLSHYREVQNTDVAQAPSVFGILGPPVF